MCPAYSVQDIFNFKADQLDHNRLNYYLTNIQYIQDRKIIIRVENTTPDYIPS